jgi:single-stranded DNA-binding protein
MQTGFGFADIDGDSGLPVGLVAFSNLADVMAKYRKGDTLRVSGKLKENNYTNKAGEEVNGYQIICEGIAGVKHAAMKHQERKPKADPEIQQQRNQATQEFYEDEISF